MVQSESIPHPSKTARKVCALFSKPARSSALSSGPSTEVGRAAGAPTAQILRRRLNQQRSAGCYIVVGVPLRSAGAESARIGRPRRDGVGVVNRSAGLQTGIQQATCKREQAPVAPAVAAQTVPNPTAIL